MNETTSTENIIKEDLDKNQLDLYNLKEEKLTDESKTKVLPLWIKNNTSTIANTAALLAFSGYFIAATSYYLKKTGGGWDLFNATTCNGYGFLVITYALHFYFFFYSYAIKPYILPPSNRLIWKPAANSLSRIKYGSIIFYLAVLAAVIAYLVYDSQDNRQRLIPISGLIIFLLIGYIFSANRSRIQWRTVIWGLILQFVFGLLTIRWKIGRNILECFGDKVNALLEYAFQGAAFVYGDNIINDNVFAFKSLSTVFFISMLVNILYYYGVMQSIVEAIGDFLRWIMGTTICESVNSAANIFVGMTESFLLLAPYLKDFTDSELHAMMLSGFASVAGSTMAAYISFGARAQDLITACIMSAPAALCYSKLLYPETEEVKVKKENIKTTEIQFSSAIDAASQGAVSAFKMVSGIISGVLAFLSFVYFINGLLEWYGGLVGYLGDNIWSLEALIGKIFTPISFVMGVPWKECEYVGTLIGIKTMVNEFVAFEKLGEMIDNGLLSERTRIIATYSICGFSNPGSVGIMISGITALAPNKKDSVNRLVLRAFWGGSIVCFMTACIAGALMPEDALGTTSQFANSTL